MSVDRAKRPAGQPGRAAWITPVLVLTGAVVFVLLLMLLPGKAKNDPEPTENVVRVSTLRIEPIERLVNEFTLKAIVEPWATVHLSAETAGRIEKIQAREGDVIRSAQPLIFLRRDLHVARMEQARAKYDFDVREARRVADAQRRNVATAMEVDTAESALKTSKAALDLSQAELDRTTIHAPAAASAKANGQIGILNHLPVEVGDYVQPGTPVAEIVDTRAVKVIVDLPERDVRFLTVGDAVKVEIEALADGTLDGVVNFIPVVANERTRTFAVEVRVDNPAGRIRAGMIARVHLTREVLADAILVPLEVLTPLGTDGEPLYAVYVVADGKATRRVVRVGMLRGQQVQVLSADGHEGLTAGDELIVKGHRLVSEGQKVEVLPNPQDAERPDVEAAGAAVEDGS